MVTTEDKPAASAQTPAVQKNLNTRSLLAWGTIALCAWIGMAEVDKLVTASVVEGQGVAITSISSPFGNAQDILPALLELTDIQRFVWWHVIFDFVYIIGYTALFLTANRSLKVFNNFFGNSMIWLLAIAEVVEDVIILFALNGSPGEGSSWWLILIVRTIKWFLALTVIIGIGFGLVRYSGEAQPGNSATSGAAPGAAGGGTTGVQDASRGGTATTETTGAGTGDAAKDSAEPSKFRAWLKEWQERISLDQHGKNTDGSGPPDPITH